jgi:hypothetical protein
MQVVYATATATVAMAEGHSVTIHQGSHWPATDPVVRARPDLFSDDARYGMSFSVPPPEVAEAPTEQATAGPGERRNVRPRG